MRYSTLSILSLFTLCLGANFAEETPVVKLPAKIEKIVQSAKSNILKEYQVEIAKLVKELEKSKIQATKAGNLKDANILDNLIKEVSADSLLAEILTDSKKEGSSDLLGNDKIDLAKSIVGGVWQYDRPDGEYVRVNKDGTLTVWWANKPFDIKNPQDSAGNWQKTKSGVVIVFYGREWTVTNEYTTGFKTRDALGGEFILKKIQ